MRPSNYDLQAQAAGHSFAAQDLDAIAARFALRRDETYLYLELLHEPLRLSRADGAAERQHGGVWMPAGFGAAMTAYDLLSNPTWKLRKVDCRHSVTSFPSSNTFPGDTMPAPY